jgi:hypothetical protein
MPANKKYLIIIGLLFLFLIGILFLFLSLSRRRSVPSAPTLTPPSLPAAETQTTLPTNPSYFIDVVPVLNRAGTTATLELYLDPQGTPINLTTLNLHAKLITQGAYVIPTSANLSVPEDLKTQGWTFPFATAATTGDKEVEIKLAAMFVSTQPYLLTQKILLASVPIRLDAADTPLTLTFMPSNNQAYTNLNELVAINQTDLTINL